MKITIASRLHPFFHCFGGICLLPRSHWSVRFFPTRLEFSNIGHYGEKKMLSFEIDLKGPIEDFVVTQDLEKALILVSGKSKMGFFRYRLTALSQGLEFYVFNAPGENLKIKEGTKSWQIGKKEKKIFPFLTSDFILSSSYEALSLGVHKKQNWEMIFSREDLRELFPLWMRLSQVIPPIKEIHDRGTAKYLSICSDLIERKKVPEMLHAFLNLWRIGFTVGMVPRLHDDEYQGIIEEISPAELSGLSPFVILHECAHLIRSLFFIQKETTLCLPKPPFIHGRFVRIRCGDLGELDIEWRKRIIRGAIFRSTKTENIVLSLPKEISSFRIRKSRNEKGKIQNSSERFLVEKGHIYYFDRFQK